MKLSSLPFFLVFLCCLTPMAGALLNVPTLHIAAAFVAGGWIISALISTKEFTCSKFQILLIIFMAGLLSIQVMAGHGYVLLEGGFYLLAIAFLFCQMLQVGNGVSLATTVRSISFIYKFLLIGMVVEFLIILAGGQVFLADLFSTTEALPYRLNAKADLPVLLGLFAGEGGLNSMLLGPQIAGMLALYSTVWFIGIRAIPELRPLERRPRFWIGLSVLMFLVSMGGTVLALAALAVLLYGIFVNRKSLKPMLAVFVGFMVVLYILIANDILFERIFSGGNIFLTQEQLDKVPEYRLIQGASSFEFYKFAFSIPFSIYSLIDWNDMLIGIGAEAFKTKFVFVGSDLGFAADILIKNGIIWTIVFTSTMIALCYPALKIYRSPKAANDLSGWRSLASLNAFLCVLWLASTLHYNQALKNSGGITIFALHLAVVMLAYKRAKTSFSVPAAGRRLSAAG